MINDDKDKKPCGEHAPKQNIVTFQLGGESHPVNEDDEIIEYIGERISALENLEKCKNLKV